MATIKQKKVINNLVENGGNVTKAMRDAGYSEATINNPSNLTKSKGYKGLLEEYGLTEDRVVTALVEDIKKKPQNRIRELALGAELLGMRQKSKIEEKSITQISFGKYDEMTNEELLRLVEANETTTS